MRAALAGPGAAPRKKGLNMRYELPPLPYPPALEPHYDAATVTLHHGKHHAAFVVGLNAALEKLAAVRVCSDFTIVKHLSREVAFHGGGRILHSIF